MGYTAFSSVGAVREPRLHVTGHAPGQNFCARRNDDGLYCCRSEREDPGAAPGIAKHGILPTLTFDDDRNTCVLTLTKGARKLSTYIEKADADACMDGPGRKCLNVAVLVTQLVEEFKAKK